MSTQFDAIFCDDIRSENNGKLILIGVYPTNLTANLPADILLSIWLRFFDAPRGDHQLSFRLVLPGGEQIDGGGEFKIGGPETSGGLAIPRIPCQIKETGKISLYANINDEPEQLVGEISAHASTSS